MDAPANPAKWWINGQECAAFTHAPGPFPFYVLMRAKHHIAMSVLIWAVDEYGVRHILRDMVTFGRNSISHHNPHHEELVALQDGRKTKLDQLSSCLHGLPGEYELTIQPFIPTHPIKVGWASNDTIL